jgi:hypothetical protein
MTHHVISLSALRTDGRSQTSAYPLDTAKDRTPAEGRVAANKSAPKGFARIGFSADRAVAMSVALRYLAARAATSNT